ncbi:MAG: DNA-deoxyinosine glycosylase [Burkholderiaceae bacterium]|nr:DNA-deoxyinosine glycosylase [Burkholderiaceae bacterium]
MHERGSLSADASGLPPPGGSPVLTGLPPVVSERTVVLVLGSFPGVASLRAGQYYAHPQNHFWRILQALWPQHPLPGPAHYALRCEWLLARGLGLWDVYARCERVGSLDSRIRNAQVNDFARLRADCPRLAAIAHNGAESFRHARSTALLEVPVFRLPSTSPANASWSFERKLNAWAELLARHGLV